MTLYRCFDAAYPPAKTPAGMQAVHAHQFAAFTKHDVSVVDEWLWARAGQGPRHA